MTFWSYWIDKENKKMAFCMPYETWDLGYKIMWRQKCKKGIHMGMVVKKRFKNRETAQERLDEIAAAKGWEKAFS